MTPSKASTGAPKKFDKKTITAKMVYNILIVVTDEDDKLVIDDFPTPIRNIIKKEELGTKKIADVKVETGKISALIQEWTKEANHKKREERHAKGKCCYRRTGNTVFFLIIRLCL
jgi:hypothetical protein